MRKLVSALARSVYRQARRHDLNLAPWRPVRSFLWPASAFQSGEAIALLINKGDVGLANRNTVAGKRVLCLVEADANTTLIRELLPAAARIDFVLQREHKTVQSFIAERKGRAPECSLQIFDNISTTGDDVEQDCSRRNYAFFESLTDFFRRFFATEPAVAAYLPCSPLLAGFVEPLAYFWCFVAPATFKILMATRRPELVMIICREGNYFGRLLPAILASAGEVPVLAGYSHVLESKRRELAGTLTAIMNAAWTWSKGPKARQLAIEIADSPGQGLAAALSRLEIATEFTLSQHWPELAHKRIYGALTTTEVSYVSYNYHFRRTLLERLARTFDLNMFLLDAAPDDQRGIQAELSEAAKAQRANAQLVSYSSSMGGFRQLLREYLERHRASWQRSLIEHAGGDWVVPIFESVIFDQMVSRISAGLEYLNFLRALFKSHPPSFAVAITGETSRTALLLAAARQAGVPTFDMQIVAMNDDPRNRVTLLPKADHYFAMDVQSAELLASWGWQPDRLYLTGTVRLDQLQELDAAAHRARGRTRLLDSGRRHLIVFISQTLAYDYCTAALQVVADAVGRRPDTKLLVKLHPREPEGNHAIYRDMLNKAAPGQNWEVTGDISIEDALLASDLVVGVYSLALIEAACLRLPVIAANLSGKRLPEPTNFGDRDCIIGASSAAELTRLIDAMLDDSAFRSEAMERQDRYFQQHAYMVDRGAMERIVRTIAEVVEGRPVSATSLSKWHEVNGIPGTTGAAPTVD